MAVWDDLPAENLTPDEIRETLTKSSAVTAAWIPSFAAEVGETGRVALELEATVHLLDRRTEGWVRTGFHRKTDYLSNADTPRDCRPLESHEVNDLLDASPGEWVRYDREPNASSREDDDAPEPQSSATGRTTPGASDVLDNRAGGIHRALRRESAEDLIGE